MKTEDVLKDTSMSIINQNKKIQNSTGSLSVNIENIDFCCSTKKKITSPRSIEALFKLGYTQEELFYINFTKFKKSYAEISHLSKEIQASRFKFYDDRRLEKIEEVKQMRIKLLENAKNFNDYETSKINIKERSKSHYQNKKDLKNNVNENSIDSQVKSTAIHNELKTFERLKKKQEMDLIGMVQQELKMQIIRKENENKQRIIKEKEEKLKKEMLLNQKLEEDIKKQKEMHKQEKLRRDEELRKKSDQEKFIEELKKEKENQEREKQRLKESRVKQEEEKRKQDEFKLQLKFMYEENKRKAEQKQTEMEEKEKVRKEILEMKKSQLQMINAHKIQKKKEQIEVNMRNLEEKINNQKNLYLEKQKHNDEKKNHFLKLREIAFKKKQDITNQRAHEIKKVLEKNEMMEKLKITLYNEKQRLIQMRKEKIEELEKQEIIEKIEKQTCKELKIKNILEKNQTLENNKKSEILEKLSYKEIKLKSLNSMKEREKMEIYEYNTMKNMERKENILRISRIQEYDRSKILERLLEKSQRVEEFKSQKSIISEKKREMKDNISRKKQEFSEKFDKIFKNKKIDDKTVNTLFQMFPNNDEVISMVNYLKQTTSTFGESQSSKYKNTTNECKDEFSNTNSKFSQIVNPINNNNIAVKSSTKSMKENMKNNNEHQSHLSSQGVEANLTENEIMKKVDDFRLKLNQNLLKLLSEERIKEEERDRIIEATNDSKEKSKLEKVFGIERAQASTRIVKFNEDIEIKIEKFEKNLRRNDTKLFMNN